MLKSVVQPNIVTALLWLPHVINIKHYLTTDTQLIFLSKKKT